MNSRAGKRIREIDQSKQEVMQLGYAQTYYCDHTVADSPPPPPRTAPHPYELIIYSVQFELHSFASWQESAMTSSII